MSSISKWILIFAVAARLASEPFACAQGSAPVSQAPPAAVAESATREIQAGHFRSAREILKQSVREYPQHPELWNLLGIAETELNQPDAGKDAFQHGLQLAPDSTSLNENMGLLFYREASYAPAKRYLEKATSLGSERADVRFSLAAARLRTGEWEKALSELTALEKPLGNLGDYWQERGTAELAGNLPAAENSFARALELTPDSVPALNGAAYAAEKQKLDEKALAFLLKARNVNPNDVQTLMHFGEVCIRRDLGVDAIEALAKAHTLEPSNNSVLYLLARANISVENWQQAFDLFHEFAGRAPKFAPTYYAMGWIDIKLGRVDDARRQLEHCLALAPDLFDARYELAQLDLSDGQLDAAEGLLRMVLKGEPRHAKANVAMGDVMLRKGSLREAQAYLQTAIQADPKLAAAHYKLSMILFREHEAKKGEVEKALAATLTAEADRASRTQLRLASPESDIVQ